MAADLGNPAEEWRHTVGVDLHGAFHVLHAFLPGMVARGSGHVVNIASGRWMRG